MPNPPSSRPSNVPPIAYAILYLGVAMIHTILGLALLGDFGGFALTTFFLTLMLLGSFCLVFGQRKFPSRALLFLVLAVGIPALVTGYYSSYIQSYMDSEPRHTPLYGSFAGNIQVYSNAPPKKIVLLTYSFLGVVLSSEFLILRALGLQIEKRPPIDPQEHSSSQPLALQQFTLSNIFEFTLYLAIALAFFLAWKRYVGFQWMHIQRVNGASLSYSYFATVEFQSICMISITTCCGLIATLVKRYLIVSCLIGAFLCSEMILVYCSMPNSNSIPKMESINKLRYFYTLSILVFAYARLRGYRWSWRWPWKKQPSSETFQAGV